MQVWLNGGLVEAEDARISPFDRGLLLGEGIETFRVYRSVPFAMTRHLERLSSSAAGLGLSKPDNAVLQNAMSEVLKANALTEARLRITITGGVSPPGPNRSADPEPTSLVAATPLSTWPATTALAVSPYRRNEHDPLVGFKTTSYASHSVLLQWAKDNGADEALSFNLADQLCEGTSSNVFVVVDGELRTPPLSSGCLNGVTRQLLLEHSPAVERDISRDDLARATEAFISSSTREVQPAASIDGRRLSVNGEFTEAAAEAIRRLVETDLDP